MDPTYTFLKFCNFLILFILNLDSATTVTGAADKVDQSYYRKITIHSEKLVEGQSAARKKTMSYSKHKI